MQPKNVVLIGYGLAGRVFHAPLIAGVQGLRLAAIVSGRTDEIGQDYPGVAALRAVEDAVGDPSVDLVVVATPNDTHFDLASLALRHGKHVVVDKPFARTSAEARALMAQAQDAGLMLSVYQNRRWDSDFLTLKRLAAEGALGEIVYFESHFDRHRPHVSDRWRERAGPATGTWYDLGSHLIDQALQLFGMPQAVWADLAAQRDGARTTDYFHAVLRYGRLRVVLKGSSLAPADDLRFVVHGTRASFVKHGFDTQEPFLGAGGRPSDPAYGTDPRPGRLVSPDGSSRSVAPERGCYQFFYEALCEALHGKGPVPVTAESALAVMQILEMGEEGTSARGGGSIKD